MRLPRPLSVRPASGAMDVLEERARLLAQEGKGPAGAEEELVLIRFNLQGATYAVELSAVEQVVSRVGTVEEVAGSPPRVRGVAFIDNLPHAVVELSHTVGAAPQPLSVLAERPALLLTRQDGALAITVEPPLEMLEVTGLRLDTKAKEGRQDQLELAGRLPDGTLLISTGWFRRFRAALEQGT